MSTEEAERAAMVAGMERQLRDAAGRRALLEQLATTDLLQRMEAVRAARTNSYQPHSTGILLPGGNHLQISLLDEVSRQIFLFGGYEEALSLAFARALAPGLTFYDVGAHYGYFAVLASQLVGWRGRVVAFEPVPATAAVLRINLAGRQNCRVEEQAVWRHSGSLLFNDAGPAHAAFSSAHAIRLDANEAVETQVIEVQATSLDDYVRAGGPRPDIVKLDVESAEMDAILGAEEVLANYRPMLTIEVGDFEHLTASGAPTSRQVLQALIDRGYDLFEAELDGLRPHALRPDGIYRFDNIIALPRGKRFAGLRPADG